MLKIKKGKNIGLSLVGIFFYAVCAFAQPESLITNIADIQRHPFEFYGKEVQVQAYFYKTDDLWVKSLDEPDKYVGMFVSKPEKDAIPLLGEYFGFIFVPQEMQGQIRLLKLGDKITIQGKCFEFQSISITGPGIKVSEVLVGWGNEAKPATASLPITREEVVSLIKKNNAEPLPPAASSATPSAAALTAKEDREKYNLYLNGKEYQGLTVGDEYTFEGISFRIEKTNK